MTVEVRFRMNPGDEDLAPRKAHDDDAAFDLRSREESVLEAGTRRLVPTGLFLELPRGYEAQVRPRSGLALKHGVTVLNTPGTIDAGYRGEVGVILINTDKADYVVHRGERIAQMLIKPVPEVELVPAAELAESARGAGGFGSTGRH